jgi:hypothetical protein
MNSKADRWTDVNWALPNKVIAAMSGSTYQSVVKARIRLVGPVRPPLKWEALTADMSIAEAAAAVGCCASSAQRRLRAMRLRNGSVLRRAVDSTRNARAPSPRTPRPLSRKYDQANWGLADGEIAREIGVTKQAVSAARRLRCIDPVKGHGGRRVGAGRKAKASPASPNNQAQTP